MKKEEENSVVKKWKNILQLNDFGDSKKYVLSYIFEHFSKTIPQQMLSGDISNNVVENDFIGYTFFSVLIKIFNIAPHTLIFTTPDDFYNYYVTNVRLYKNSMTLLYPKNDESLIKFSEYIVEKYTNEDYKKFINNGK